jgi:hypothetical protein
MLLERYNLEDPVISDERGVFTNNELQLLYNKLVLKGNESLVEALKVGAEIEEIDILDLEEQINQVVDNKDILLVYNNLLRGSRNHLRAFVRNLSSQDEIYYPLFLTQEAYDIIINSGMERGGKGKRRGKGKGGRRYN